MESLVDNEDVCEEQSFIDLSSINPDIWRFLEKDPGIEQPIDRRDFDSVQYLNEKFPDEASLEFLDQEMAEVQRMMRDSEHEIRSLVRSEDPQSTSHRVLQATTEATKEIVGRFINLGKNLDAVQEEVENSSNDIRKLDIAKRNMSLSLKIINQMNIFVKGLQELEEKPCVMEASVLCASIQKMDQVAEYLKQFDIPEIRENITKYGSVKESIKEIALKQFRECLKGGMARKDAMRARGLCKLVSTLGNETRQRAISWYSKEIMHEYLALFEENQEASWLDRVDNRYTWLKKTLIDIDERQSCVFPVEWEIPRRLSEEFCARTKSDLCSIMRKNLDKVDIKLLKYVIQRTTAFEILLDRRFNEDVNHSSTNPFEEDTVAGSSFYGAISFGFRQFLDIYFVSARKSLDGLISKFSDELKSSIFHTPANEAASNSIISSSADLFVFFKGSLNQLSKLADEEILVKMCSLFDEYLRNYKSQVLGQFISASSSGVRLKETEVCRICRIIATIEYCIDTSKNLQSRMRGRLSEQSKPEILDLSVSLKLFDELLQESIQCLVNDAMGGCEPNLGAMIKTAWHTYEAVGDQSVYVNGLLNYLAKSIPILKANLAFSDDIFVQFCLEFMREFLKRYTMALLKCKPLTIAAAEQLLLDAHSIKSALIKLPFLGQQQQQQQEAHKSQANVPSSLTDMVHKWMNEAELLLKMVMSSHEVPDNFVATYRCVLPGRSRKLFQKVLDMKGLRKSEQQKLTDAFNAKSARRSITTEENSQSDSVGEDDGIGPMSEAIESKGASSSHMKRLGNLMRNFIE